jgi:hypothetical protein
MTHCDGALKDGHALRVLVKVSFDILRGPERILLTLRAPGSPMAVSTLIRPGRSVGRKGRTVMGESTSFDMLSTTL